MAVIPNWYSLSMYWISPPTLLLSLVSWMFQHVHKFISFSPILTLLHSPGSECIENGTARLRKVFLNEFKALPFFRTLIVSMVYRADILAVVVAIAGTICTKKTLLLIFLLFLPWSSPTTNPLPPAYSFPLYS